MFSAIMHNGSSEFFPPVILLRELTNAHLSRPQGARPRSAHGDGSRRRDVASRTLSSRPCQPWPADGDDRPHSPRRAPRPAALLKGLTMSKVISTTIIVAAIAIGATGAGLMLAKATSSPQPQLMLSCFGPRREIPIDNVVMLAGKNYGTLAYTRADRQPSRTVSGSEGNGFMCIAHLAH